MLRLPLAAIRVIELDAGLAGAWCGRILAALGAEVIKIEPPRAIPAGPVRADVDRNKLGVAVDFAAAEGRALLLRLVGLSRAVIAPADGAVVPLDALREAKRDLIVVSLPPGADDVTLGTAAAAGTLVALLKHRRTGKGTVVRPQAGGLAAAFCGERALRSLPLSVAPPDAPCGCFPAREGAIAVSVSLPGEFAALCRAIGERELVADGRFADAAARVENAAELERRVSAWAAARDAEEAAQALQEAGVAAAPVVSAVALGSDAHLWQRGFFELVSAVDGERELARLPWRFSRMSPHTRLPAPRPGEHNAYVLRDLLGLPAEEIDMLSRRGVVSGG